MSLTAKNIKPNGKVDLWDLGPPKDDPERKKWEKSTGPHQVELWAVDARHALAVDSDRFALKLPNGVKPGPAQTEREAKQDEEQSDPHFGARMP